MTYVLHGEKGSGSFSSEAALTLAGADFRIVELDFSINEQLGDKHRRVNPTGKVPALELPSGEIVTESAAILLTIAEHHPDAELLPPERSAARASAYRWIVFLSSEIYPMVEIVDYPARFLPETGTEALREAARGRMRERFLMMEKNAAGPWMLETGFSAVDIYAANIASFFIGDGWRREHCPKIDAILRGVSQHPAIALVWQKHFGHDVG